LRYLGVWLFLLSLCLIGCNSSNSNVNTPPDLESPETIDTSKQWVKTSKLSVKNQMLYFASDNEKIYLGTVGGGFFYSKDNGDNWIPSNYDNNDLNYTALAVFSDKSNNTIILAANSKKLISSSDHGMHWNLIRTILGDGIASIDVVPNQLNSSILFYGENPIVENGIGWSTSRFGGEFRSTDEGNSWEAVSGIPSHYYLRNITVSSNSSYLYGVSWNGIYYSSDNGNSWTKISSPEYIGSLTTWIDEKGAGIYVSNYQGVFYSTNNGVNWNSFNNGLDGKSVSCFLTWNDYLFAGTNKGVYLSKKNSGVWIATNLGLENSSIQKLIVHGSYIFAGTSDGEVWRRLLSNIQNN
jgi:hypothetical protein